MNARLLVVAGIAAAVLVGCTPRRIPGTQILETDDNLEIIEVMKKYRQAVENRDADAIVALASTSFRDEGGTPTPEDDLTYDTLGPALRERFGRLDYVDLDMEVRTIEVMDDVAQAVYYYTLRFTAPGLTDKSQSASDIKKMYFKREDGRWRIVSGI